LAYLANRSEQRLEYLENRRASGLTNALGHNVRSGGYETQVSQQHVGAGIPISTLIHDRLLKRGLDLKPDIGRDLALISEVAAKLGIPPNRLITNLTASKKSAEEYLRDYHRRLAGTRRKRSIGATCNSCALVSERQATEAIESFALEVKRRHYVEEINGRAR
jgi:hypothetical protein